MQRLGLAHRSGGISRRLGAGHGAQTRRPCLVSRYCSQVGSDLLTRALRLAPHDYQGAATTKERLCCSAGGGWHTQSAMEFLRSVAEQVGWANGQCDEQRCCDRIADHHLREARTGVTVGGVTELWGGSGIFRRALSVCWRGK